MQAIGGDATYTYTEHASYLPAMWLDGHTKTKRFTQGSIVKSLMECLGRVKKVFTVLWRVAESLLRFPPDKVNHITWLFGLLALKYPFSVSLGVDLCREGPIIVIGALVRDCSTAKPGNEWLTLQS